MDEQERDLDLALFTERIRLPLLKPPELFDRVEQRLERFIDKLQLINPGFREDWIPDYCTGDLLCRAEQLERRITLLETKVAAAQARNSDSRTHALEREIARLHARIDSISGDLNQRLSALALRLVEMDMQVRLQQAPATE